MAAIPNWTSSGHLRCCSDGNTTKQSFSCDKNASILSLTALMGYYKLLIFIFTALDTIWC
eukprot:scaffold4753_cov107-Skeletonema_marinoi.AAC.3